MSFNQANHWNTEERASVIACSSQADRAVASDRLRADGFRRLYYFQTVSGKFCVEGLKDDQPPINPEILDEMP